jgi:FkbM family methyltransferase
MLKHSLKRLLNYAGLEIRKVQRGNMDEVGTDRRPIGHIRFFLEDVAHRHFSPRGIIDVGANRGEWTQMAKDIFPDATVLMIEPQDEMMPLLQKICRQEKHVELVQAGAGSTAGELVQTIWKDLNGSSFIPDSGNLSAQQSTQRVTPIVTLNDLMTERPSFSPDLVKMDIQGFEVEALKGATDLLGKTELFILETSLFRFMNERQPLAREIIAFMDEAGYEIYDITEHLRRPSDGALGQVDFAFAKRNGFLRQNGQW